jgi:hypothetical protein
MKIAGVCSLLGVIAMALSLLMSTAVLRDAHLPMPLAICGAALFLGGVHLSKR